jgi:hypothetical protein
MKFKRILNKSAFKSMFENKISKIVFDYCYNNISDVDTVFILCITKDDNTIDSVIFFVKGTEDGINALEYWYKTSIDQLVEIIQHSVKWLHGYGFKQIFFTVDSLDAEVNSLMEKLNYTIKTKVYEYTNTDIDLEEFERNESKGEEKIAGGGDNQTDPQGNENPDAGNGGGVGNPVESSPDSGNSPVDPTGNPSIPSDHNND